MAADKDVLKDLTDKELLTNGSYEAIPERGLAVEVCKQFYYQVGEVKGKKVHIANYLNQAGEIVSQKIRDLDKRFEWRQYTADKQLFGAHISKQRDTIFICEGELDALTLTQVGVVGAISISTGAGNQTVNEITRHLDYLEGFKKIVLIFDNDKVGQDTAVDVAKLFSPGKVWNLCLQKYKDPNEYLQKDESKALLQELQTGLIRFVPKAIKTPSKALLLSEDRPRTPLPLPQLQEMIRGVSMDEGEIWLLGAGAKAGKSTFTKELSLGLLDAHPDFKVAVCYMEESLKKAAQSIIAMDNKVPIQDYKENRALISQEKFDKSYSKYIENERIKFIDATEMKIESEEILNTIKYLIVGLGYKFIILDHITMITYAVNSKQGERKDIDILMRGLRDLVSTYPATILTVCHLSRPQFGKGYDEGRDIHATDFRGSGIFEQICDVMLGVERNLYEDQNKTYTKVILNRITGLTGYTDLLYHNPKTGRLQIAENELL